MGVGRWCRPGENNNRLDEGSARRRRLCRTAWWRRESREEDGKGDAHHFVASVLEKTKIKENGLERTRGEGLIQCFDCGGDVSDPCGARQKKLRGTRVPV